MATAKLQVIASTVALYIMLAGVASRLGSESATAWAGVAAAAVQRFYNPVTGLFCSGTGNCWWWSANRLTALIDYSRQAKSKIVLDALNTQIRK